MNRRFPFLHAGLVLATLLLIPFLALAQGPHEGIYFGTFQGPLDDGEFALIVNDQGHGTLAAYDVLDDSGLVEHDIHIRSDGSFRFLIRDGTLIAGRITAGGISGSYVSGGIEGAFAGLRAADDGALQDAAGYYSGPASITESEPAAEWVINSHMVAIIAADGNAFFMLDRAFPGLGGSDPGFGSGQIFPGADPFWPGGFNFDLDLDLGLGVDLDLDAGFQPPIRHAGGFCGPFRAGHGFDGWPFNFSWNYSLRISLWGPFDLDLDFSYHLPTCRSSWTWNHFPAPVGNSGGTVLITADGLIQGTLLDGLLLEGFLDPLTTQAQGILFQQQGAAAWDGHWQIDRRFGTDSTYVTQHFERLSDVNGDGLADITWRHVVTADNAVWLMDGAEILAELPLDYQTAFQRTPAPMSDRDDDVMPDLVWQRQADGEFIIWLGNSADPFYLQPDHAWHIAGGGDFDGDGSIDIIWRDDNAATVMVTLNPGEAGAENFQLAANVTRDWQLGAIGDLDGDGADNLVWRHRVTGEITAWRVVDRQVVTVVPLTPVPDPYWTIQP